MYTHYEYKDAKLLKKMIETRYKDGIKTYGIQAKLVPYSNIKTSQANMYYLFPAKAKNIKDVVKKAATNRALTFSYLRDDLQYRVMISLSVSNKIKPLLNLDAIKRNKISLRPVLIEISNIYISKANARRNHSKQVES